MLIKYIDYMIGVLTPGFFMSGGGSSAYEIKNSLRFRAASSTYMAKASVPGVTAKNTMSFRFKRGLLGVDQYLYEEGTDSANRTYIHFTASDVLRIVQVEGGTTTLQKISTQVFRDTGAWYHAVVTFDRGNAVAEDRVKVEVNNARVVSWSTNTIFSASGGTFINGTSTLRTIGATRLPSIAAPFDGELAHFYLIENQALSAASFGYTDALTGQWRPKKYTGTYGTNGFFLPFTDGASTSALGVDGSGNGNHWTLVNFVRSAGVTDCWLTDTPTNNFATLDPIFPGANGLSHGNLTVTYSAGSVAYSQLATMTLPGGRWYSEGNLSSYSVGSVANNVMVYGWRSRSNPNTRIVYGWQSDGSIMRHRFKYELNGVVQSAINIDTTAPLSSDVFGLDFDIDSGVITASKNGVQTAQISGVANVGDWTPCVQRDGTTNASTWNLNYGQRPFANTPPIGSKALCTKNLPVPSIKLPKKHFDALTWTGNATYPRSITGADFSPDLVWAKTRSIGYNHVVYDSARGVGNNKALYTNATEVEGSQTTIQNLTSFDSGGFSLGAVSGTNILNDSGNTRVAWLWKAGGAPVANNAGSITSQVSANVAAGFSIVTYTGTGANATVGHGLGVAPKMVIHKIRNAAGNWPVYHASMDAGPNNYYAQLNTTSAKINSGSFYQLVPSASLLNLSTLGDINSVGNTYVAYCFAEVPGFSKIGSYTGNGSADGPFVWCGFRPRFVMIKRTDTTGNWLILDTARDPANVMSSMLNPNLADAEVAGSAGINNWDALSNGFKARGNGALTNASGGTYIFWAIAEAPFKYANAR